jgi:transposase-like protein
VYPIVFLDCIVVKSREEGKVCNRSVYLALGVTMEGQKDILGMWIAQNEGAKFWLGVITELKNCGIKDILIACVDGLKGFPAGHQAALHEAVYHASCHPKVSQSLFPPETYKHSILFWCDINKLRQFDGGANSCHLHRL